VAWLLDALITVSHFFFWFAYRFDELTCMFSFFLLQCSSCQVPTDEFFNLLLTLTSMAREHCAYLIGRGAALTLTELYIRGCVLFIYIFIYSFVKLIPLHLL